MRLGQISGQAFVYILALIIFAGVLLYGYKAVQKFGEQSEELLITQLTTNIRTQVEKIERQYGSVEKLKLDISTDFEQICFIDIRNQCDVRNTTVPGLDCIRNSGGPKDHSVEEYPLICDAWKDCTPENLFLVSGSTVQGYNIGYLSVKDGFFCTNVTLPKTMLRLKGFGEHAEISPW